MLKKRKLIFLSLFILGVLLLSSCFLNPPAIEGILKGQIMVPEGFIQVKDLTGVVLPDATVNIIDLETGAIIATTVTDADGYYQVSVPPGGPYLLEAVKDGVKLEQITCSVEVGMEYDLGTADCTTTAAALIAQAMMDAGDDPADIDCDAIIADSNFDDVSSIVCSTIQAGQDPTVSAAVLQAVEDFLNPPEPAPTPTPNPTPLSDAKAITAFDFEALDPDVVGVINEGAKTISLTVPFGTGVTALIPTIVHTGTSVSPASGTVQDFTLPLTYTVTAEDTSSQAYLVTVTVTAPVIATTSTIANGAITPIITVTGTNFKAGIAAVDLTVGVETTGLTLGTVSFVSATEITAIFTGTAAAGEVTIQAKTSAFNPASILASNTLTITVPAAVINIAAITGVTAPVAGANPDSTITETTQYTGSVIWAPTDDPFAAKTAYTAWIILAPKPGFTLTGVTANFFTVAGAITVTNMIDSGVVTAVFPATAIVAVGDSCGGGIVAYILGSLDPGYEENKQHGLIAATADQSTGIPWYNGSYEETGATDTAIGTGLANTNKIIDVQGETTTDYAAGLARAYDGGGYDDWFLPSKEELNKLYLNKVAIGGFADSSYWSSSEINANDAWLQSYVSGFQYLDLKFFTFRVRAVRAF